MQKDLALRHFFGDLVPSDRQFRRGGAIHAIDKELILVQNHLHDS